jgi:hypothetical protein
MVAQMALNVNDYGYSIYYVLQLELHGGIFGFQCDLLAMCGAAPYALFDDLFCPT